MFSQRVLRYGFRIVNNIINPMGLLLSKPEIIHGSPAFSGATLFARRQIQMRRFYDLTKTVEGGIVESGVHWGYGILIHLLGADERRIYGFDSFEGHSSPHEKDKKGGSYRPLDNSFRTSQKDVYKTLEIGLGVDYKELADRVELIPGWINETMPEFRARAKADGIRLSFVHADCDIYEPFLATLVNTWDALSIGGVVAVGYLDNPELAGKTSAVKEFLNSLPSNTYKLESFSIIDNGLSKRNQSYLVKIEA